MAEALELLKAHHEPYPLVVVDRTYRVRDLNCGAAALFTAVLGLPPSTEPLAPSAVEALELNLARLTFDPDGAQPSLANFDDVGRKLLWRIQREVLADPDDGEMRQLLDELLAMPTVDPHWRQVDLRVPSDPALVLHLRHGTDELRFLTTVTAFQAPQNVAVEHLSPAGAPPWGACSCRRGEFDPECTRPVERRACCRLKRNPLVTGPARHGRRRRRRGPARPAAGPLDRPARSDRPAPTRAAPRPSPSANPSQQRRARHCRRAQLDRDSTSTARHGPARRQHREPLERTQQHMGGACRDRSNRHRRVSPRRRSLHALANCHRISVCQPFARGQCRIRQNLLGKRHRRQCRVTTELLGHPPRKGHLKALDDRHDVVGHADRLVRHVHIIRTGTGPSNPPPDATCSPTSPISPADSPKARAASCSPSSSPRPQPPATSTSLATKSPGLIGGSTGDR